MDLDDETVAEIEELIRAGEHIAEDERGPDGILMRIWTGFMKIIHPPLDWLLRGDWVTPRKVWVVRRFWHGFVGWVITMFVAGMALTYSTGSLS